ncbi:MULTISPECIES: hypothetical protein [Pseudomonas]|uniref:Chemotaxis protein CheY n=1 Tax=Pseudomonas lactis TaxID=1615674 RepID=A0ABS9FW31_9PSED|nr:MULTISPECIES: hypothetical protein [Pseudomonas]MBI6978203.1 hypothetical protein [Pseudomonas lactis]MCF4973513.1 hypothetical protein [Pseudomonas lactis]MCF5003107.1 hypothetical protein [Pseudomonas lactis]MCF5007428.1 hypothetical protein [Pseudomonas lactis]MCF5015069.1 hypothetical protein [Pseudomonas lactis]
MPTPSLRILIIDPEHLQRLSIEKMLNRNGYHRIAPIASFEELVIMVDHAQEPFDLVVINTASVSDTGICLEDFCIQCPSIRNALIYEGTPAGLVVNDDPPVEGVVRRLSGVPDTREIEKLMSRIDPRQKQAVRRLLFGRERP